MAVIMWSVTARCSNAAAAASVELVTAMRGQDREEDHGHILKYTAVKQGSPAGQTTGSAGVDVLVALT